MSSTALNNTYKTGILAMECSALSADVAIAATTIHCTGIYMTQTPFVIGQEYTIMDGGLNKPNTWTSGANGLPNAEKFMLIAATQTSTPQADGVGWSVASVLTVQGFGTGSLWTGGLNNAYTQANGAIVLTPGVEMSIQSADFNCRFKTLTDAPKVAGDDEASRFASGDEGRDLTIMGERTGEITFTQKLSWAGSVTTVPTYDKLMKTMGHLLKAYTTTGLEYLPHTWANEITATIWIIAPENGASPTSTVWHYRGCHGGNGSGIGSGKVGDVDMLTAKYSGAYVGMSELSNAQARILTSPTTSIPEVMLNNAVTIPSVYGHAVTQPGTPYASVTALVTAEVLAVGDRFYVTGSTDNGDGSLATAKSSALTAGDAFTVATSSTCTYVTNERQVQISQWNLDFGAVVNPFYDQSTSTGPAYFAQQDRDPKLTINPLTPKKSLDDFDLMVSKAITGPVTIASALSNPHITVGAANAQCMYPAIASREGYVNTNRNYRCLRNNLGAGATDSALPDGCMYGVLIGARS